MSEGQCFDLRINLSTRINIKIENAHFFEKTQIFSNARPRWGIDSQPHFVHTTWKLILYYAFSL
jgi:hypothetical protein